MRTLYYLPLSPFCRKVRLILKEKKLDFQLVQEKTWERRTAFLKLNAAGEVPVLVDENNQVVADSQVIAEYLEETYPEINLLGNKATERNEVRRLCAWFDQKFYREVGSCLVFEKVFRRMMGRGGPDSTAIRTGNQKIHSHLEYITWLMERRRWLAGDQLSLADLTAAAHLSSVDYLGDVPWDKHEMAKDWYVRVKSRPSFRTLLDDWIPSIMPAAHYADLDF